MSDLIVVAFDDEATAFEMRAALVKLQGDYLLKMEDVVVVTKSTDGKVALHQAVNLTAVGAEAAFQRELTTETVLPEWRCPCCGALGGLQRLTGR